MSSSRLEYWRLSGLPARQTQDEKRHDEAVADAKRAIQLAPGSADAAELASYVLAASGHPEEAAVRCLLLAHLCRADLAPPCPLLGV